MAKSLRVLVLLLSASSVWLLLPGVGFAQEAVTAHRRTLDELVDESAFILHGHVVGLRVEPHPELKNLTTMVVTIEVLEALKGDVSRIFTFRQFVWDVRATTNSGYKKGQEVFLFLRPPSRYGLTSPAGLSQGRFVVQADASGRQVTVNADNNLGLFASLPAAAKRRRATLPAAATALSAQRGGPVSLKDLKDVVRSLIERSR